MASLAASTINGRPLFEPYPKIVGSSSRWQGRCGQQPSTKGAKFVVTEKIHGANFGLVVHESDGHPAVAFAKRSGLLAADEDFFGVRSAGLAEELADGARRVFAAVTTAHAQVASVVVYGELFGGEYPGIAPSVCQPVQHGVYYCNHLEFIAFDVAVFCPSRARRFLDFSEAKAVVQESGLRFAQPLLEGTWEEALAFDHRFVSTIPALLGMPPLDDARAATNLAEGVVIKAVHEDDVAKRRVVKRKIDDFAERVRDEAAVARRQQVAAEDGACLSRECDAERLQLWRFEVLANVCSQRLDSVLSKEGALDLSNPTECRRLVKLLVDDAVGDARADNTDEAAWVDTLGPDCSRGTRKLAAQAAREVIVNRVRRLRNSRG